MSRPFSLRKYIDGFLNYLAKGGFLKAIAKLSGATVLGQIISVLSSIILTRLYSPADFGVLGVFTALSWQCLFACAMSGQFYRPKKMKKLLIYCF
jgi:hypothetical protein